MSLNALPDEIIYKIFVDNNLTYRDAQNLRKGLEDVDPELSERIHSLIISPFTDSYLFHHLEMSRTGTNPDPDFYVPLFLRKIKYNYY